MWAASEDGTIKTFDLLGKGFMKAYHHKAMINAAELHPCQTEIYFGDEDGKVMVWDLVKDEARELFIDDEKVGIRSVSVSKDGKRLVASNSIGQCFIWIHHEGDFIPM